MKLIREFDDFDWIREVPVNPWLLWDGIYFDIEPKADDVRTYIQMALDNLPIKNYNAWKAPYTVDIHSIIDNFYEYGTSVLANDDGYFTFSIYNTDYGPNMKWIKYSDLVKGKLNESHSDDLDWIRKVPLNPWFLGDGIYFDIEPKVNDVRAYIQMALDNRQVENRKYWHKPYDTDVNTIIDYFRQHGSAVLGIDKDGFSSLTIDATPQYYADDMKWIKYSDLVKGKLNESHDDGLDWIRKIPAYVHYDDVVVGEFYAVNLNPLLFEALFACEHSKHTIKRFKKANNVKVAKEKLNDRYNSVFCGHPREDEVRSLFLEFYDGDEYIDYFWVVEGMVEFLPMDYTLNESHDDGLDWIREIDPSGPIELDPETVYYFEPSATEEELYRFAKRVSDLTIKDFLIHHLDLGLKYFALDKWMTIIGWCDETPLDEAKTFYPNYNFVNAKEQFFF